MLDRDEPESDSPYCWPRSGPHESILPAREFPQARGYQRRSACLVAHPQALSRIGVVVLVNEQGIPPGGVFGQEIRQILAGTPSVSSAYSVRPPVGSGCERSKIPGLSRPRMPSANMCLPAAV